MRDTTNQPRPTSRGRRIGHVLLALSAVGVAAALFVGWRAGLGPQGSPNAPSSVATSAVARTPAARAELQARGAALAQAGNCAACHTARGGAPWAGGRAIPTPFGTVYAGNLTPDPETGLGRWTADDFWRALHHGRSRDGRFLLPAFPYPQYTRIQREDADALWAHLQSLPPVRQAAPAHQLRFPYDTQAALAVWRALYFRPGVFEADTQRSPAWNRGAYLVEGLGHCAACHGGRNVLGANPDQQALGGGDIPMLDWYAPALNRADEASVADWPLVDIVALLQTGRAPRASVLGPMAEVVAHSTQHLSGTDLLAMATYLQALPLQAAHPVEVPEKAPEDVAALGAELYRARCADCHGAQGQGRAPAYPALAGNRAVTLHTPTNLIRTVLGGAFGPSTAAHPQPYGMPPYGQDLSDAEIAAVLTHIRQQWGHQASAVSPLAVQRLR